MQLLNQLLLKLLYELGQQHEMLFEVLICKEEFNRSFSLGLMVGKIMRFIYMLMGFLVILVLCCRLGRNKMMIILGMMATFFKCFLIFIIL
jgi:hypothetical protein